MSNYLWKLTATWEVEWDVTAGFVVRASTEPEARLTAMAADNGDGDPQDWVDKAACDCIGTAFQSGTEVILMDFRNA